MKTKKKKNRKIISIIILIILICTIFSVSISADQYGETPIQIYTNEEWANQLAIYIPNAVPANENQYAVYIDLELFWQLESNAIDSFAFSGTQRTGNNPANYEEVYIQVYGTRGGESNTLTFVSEEFLAGRFTISNTSHPTGIVIIPLYTLEETVDTGFYYGTENGDVVMILNNWQLQAINNNLEEYMQEAYGRGYAAGAQEAEIGEAGARLILATVEAPMNIMQRMLDFEILGVNLFGLAMSVFTLCLIAAVVKHII